MRALVTGGGGFIGSHLVERLLSDGHEVCVLDNFATGRRENLVPVAEHVRVIEGDVQSYERAHAAVLGCEVVFHQAALPSVPRSIQDPLTTNAVNVIGTLNVLLAARDAGVRRVVFASSSSVYGANRQLPKQETMAPAPMSPYAVGKLAGEGYCRSFDEVYGLETLVLRYFNVFGPRQDPLSQYSAVIPNFITAALSGESPIVFGDGAQSRDFTYVDNVVEANLLAMDAAVAGGTVLNIASGKRTSLLEVLGVLGQLTGRTIQPKHGEARPGEVPHSHANVEQARMFLGFFPRTTFDDGLARTVEFFAREVRSADGAFP